MTKHKNVDIGNVSNVRSGTVNITPGRRGSGSVRVGNIENVSGGQINIAAGDIHPGWSGDSPKRRHNRKKKKGFWRWLFSWI